MSLMLTRGHGLFFVESCGRIMHEEEVKLMIVKKDYDTYPCLSTEINKRFIDH